MFSVVLKHTNFKIRNDMNKRYFALSSLDYKDELYVLTKAKEKKFERLFGAFDSVWDKHEEAVNWLRKNAKFVDYCTCLT